MERFRAIELSSPIRSKAPMEIETVTAVMQAIAMNRPVSLRRIDQSRNGLNFNIPIEPYLNTRLATLKSWELIRSPACVSAF